jgi:hypothetical protein
VKEAAINPPGHAQDAGGKREFDVEMAAGLGRDRCHGHGHGEVEAADEGVVKRRRAGEDIAVDVVGKEDTARLPYANQSGGPSRTWAACLQQPCPR